MKTNRYWNTAAALTAMGWLSACGQGQTLDTQDISSVEPIPQSTVADTTPFQRGPHIMPIRDPATAADTTAKNTAASTHLWYWGGHVIPNVKVYSVFWTSAVNATTQSQIGGFFTAVTANAYIDWLSEYNTSISGENGVRGTNQTIGRGSYGGSITITPSITTKALTNDNITAELNHQLDIGALPAADQNSLYMFFFPAGYSISLGTAKSCTQFCAYHNTIQRAGSSVYYGVIPDVGADGCQLGCGLDKTVFNNLTTATSHEMVEAITDAEVGLALDAGPPLGWYDQAKGEIGDICADQEDTLPGTSYKIQKEWSNKCNACITTPAAGCNANDGTPVVGITSPGNGDTVTGTTLTVKADADGRGTAITEVDFTINFFFPLGKATKAPYSITKNISGLKAGTYYLTAKAKGANGKVVTSGNTTFVKM